MSFYILSPCLYNLYAEYIMQNARLEEAQAGIKVARRNINVTSDRQMTPPLWPKVKRNLRFSWWGWKRRVKKTGLKLNIQTTKIMASGLIISCQTDWKKWNHWQILSSWAPKSLQTVTAVMKLKDVCSLEEKLECCSACNSNSGFSYRQSLYFGMQK